MDVKALVKKPVVWAAVLLAIGLVVWLAAGGSDGSTNEPNPPGPGKIVFGEPIDDWAYDPVDVDYESASGGLLSTNSIRPTSSSRGSTLGVADSATIGLAVGGSNDINNFRQNVDNGYLPSPADISHEGLFYDYFFETGPSQECDQLFCPAYATAISPDPFSGHPEHFLAVGLNSNISVADFQRKQLNLVVVLDISGSMSSSFNRYYYDQSGSQPGGSRAVIEEDSEAAASKMEVAAESLVALLEHLGPEDRLGVVLFDDRAYDAKPLRLVGETDLDALRSHILELSPQGSTNMEAGYRAGTEMLAEYREADPDNYENRIIFLTDAQPNLGNLNRDDLAKLAEDNAEDSVFTSFIGIGVDFNAELVQAITQTRGANYFSVHSATEFKRQLDEGFDYMVTPLVFDLDLRVESSGYDIRAVYGSPEADLATGEIMKINTLFPSLRVDDQTRGGLVLLHLDRVSDTAADLTLSVNYTDRGGQSHRNQQTIEFADSAEPHFDHTGIHKGVVLARMVNVMHDWLRYESQPVATSLSNYRREGIPILESPIDLSPWERPSQPLRLSDQFRSPLTVLRDYIDGEIPAIDDDSLAREVDLINSILNHSPGN